MPELILVRHAKSDWGDLSLSDFDRPLNARGKKNAPFMGKMLRQKKVKPDLIVSSPAKRAKSTAKRMAEELDYAKEKIVFEQSVYESDVKTLLKIVNAFPDKKKKIMLVGHNPGMTDFLNYLSDAGIVNLPTCAVAIIRFDCGNWQEVSGGTGTLTALDFPKNYPNSAD